MPVLPDPVPLSRPLITAFRWALLTTVLSSAAVLSACGRVDEAASQALVSPAQRAVAPSFDYTSLDGKAWQSQALAGQVVLVNFWATSCAVCVKEMPELVRLHQRFSSQGLRTLAVAVQQDPPALVDSFARSRQLPMDVVIDNTGAIARAFGPVRGTPTFFLIDRQGRIAWRGEGAPDFAGLQRMVASLLATNPA